MELPGVFLNDEINNVEVPVVVPNNKTVGMKKKTVGSKNKTFDVDHMNTVDLPVVFLNKKTVGRKDNICNV